MFGEGFSCEYEKFDDRPAFESLEKAKSGVEKVESFFNTMKSKSVEQLRIEETRTEIALVESETGGSEPQVVISWDNGGYVKFIPITEGRGSERGLYGYHAVYGFKANK